jgi:hypothetical protein
MNPFKAPRADGAAVYTHHSNEILFDSNTPNNLVDIPTTLEYKMRMAAHTVGAEGEGEAQPGYKAGKPPQPCCASATAGMTKKTAFPHHDALLLHDSRHSVGKLAMTALHEM